MDRQTRHFTADVDFRQSHEVVYRVLLLTVGNVAQNIPVNFLDYLGDDSILKPQGSCHQSGAQKRMGRAR